MAERNVTFLVIAKDFASKALRDVGDNSDRAAKKLRELNTQGMGPLATAGAALGPALLPVMAGATVAAVGLGTALVGAGAAVGVFGAVTKSVFSEVLTASKKSEALRTTIRLLTREIKVANEQGDSTNAGKFEQQRAKALIEYRARLLELPMPMRMAVIGMDDMRTAWQSFVEKNRTPVLGILARGMELLASVLPKLTPLFRVGAQAVSEMLGAFEGFVSGGGLTRVVAYLSAQALPNFRAFGGILMSLGYGIGQLLAPMAATSGSIVSGLDRMSSSFARWARESGRAGVERMVAYAKANAPAAGAALATLATSIKTIATAVAPLAPVSLAVATALGQIINALPQPVLTGLVGSMIAFNVALRGAMVATKVGAAVGILVGIFTGVSAAVTGNTLATDSNTAAKVANRVVTFAITAATKAWAAAQWLLNVAMNANPIGLIIIGLVALGIGFYEAYKHSEKFRAVVQMALHAVLGAAKAVGDWFGKWPAFFSGVWGKVVGAFNTAKDAITGTFTTVKNAITGALAATGRTISSWFTATVGWFEALPGRILRALVALPGQLLTLFLNGLNMVLFAVGYAIGRTIRYFIELPGNIMRGLAVLGGLLASVWNASWASTKRIVSAGVNSTVAFFRALPGRARAALATLWGAISGAFTTAKNNVVKAVSSAVSSAVSFFASLPGKARNALASLWSRMVGVWSAAVAGARAKGTELVNAAVRIVTTLPGKIGNALRAVPGRVTGAFAGAGSWLLSAGGDILRGLANGISGAIGAVVEQAKRAAQSVVDGVRKGLGIGSPSTVFRDQVGRWIPAGIAVGIDKAAPVMHSTLNDQLQQLIQSAAMAGSAIKWGGVPEPAGWNGAQGGQMYAPPQAVSVAASVGAGQMSGGGSSSGGDTYITVTGAVDPTSTARQIRDLLVQLKRDQGGITLGIA